MSLFGVIKDVIKIPKVDREVTSMSLRLMRYTTILLIALSTFSTLRQFIGDPIHCQIGGDFKTDKDVLKNFCWFEGSFSRPSLTKRQQTQHHSFQNNEFDCSKSTHLYAPKPRVINGRGGDPNLREKRYTNYYIWVCFFFIFEGLLCYVPYKLWKILKGDRIKTLLDYLKKNSENSSDGTRLLSDYLARKHGRHTWFAVKYQACHVLMLVSVVGQVYLMDHFLQGEFLTYGTDVFRITEESNRCDPLSTIFPRLTKCHFQYYGPSGGLIRVDTICVLPHNIINEKLFIGIWFWYFGLAIVLSVLFLYDVAVIINYPIRRLHLKQYCSGQVPLRLINQIVDRIGYGDLLLIVQLARNMDKETFAGVLEGLARRFGANSERKREADLEAQVQNSSYLPSGHRFGFHPDVKIDNM